MDPDLISYRKTLGQFTTGVTIITTTHEGRDYGFTANSFTSVSLDPSLVLFCIQKDATFLLGLMDTNSFCINILAKTQEDLSNKFANPSILNEQRFNGLNVSKSVLGNPIIGGSIAYLDCAAHQQIDAGDHILIIGEVKHHSILNSQEPLLYFGGGYRGLESK